MNWIEWKGEKVGDLHHTVCACIYSYIDDGEPVIAIIPRALCWGCKERRTGNAWEFFEGDSSKYHQLTRVPRKCWDKTGDDYINVFRPERGDKIYYCVPTLPTGEAFSLNSVRKSFYKGLSVVCPRTDLLQEKDLEN